MGEGRIRTELSGAVTPDELFSETLRASSTGEPVNGVR
jgi:hypothetical protein